MHNGQARLGLELEQCLEKILDSLDEGVFIADRRGKTLVVNRMYEELTGLARSELLGRGVEELKEQGLFNLAPITPSIVESGKPVTSVQIGRDNRRVVIDGRPIFGASGEVELVIIFVRDITLMSALKEQMAKQSLLIEKYHSQVKYLRNSGSKPPLPSLNPGMLKLWEMLRRVADTDASVLLLGETGVGKGVFARALHELSRRRERAFFKVDCAAIPENLIESELFGYAPGAFSGANPKGKFGFFDMADKGTIFLDEIGELPLGMQAKLLRVLQDEELVRVGGTRPVRVDVRVVAATNQNLEKRVAEGSFRGDLYYRLRVSVLEIPPLREHREDIMPLTRHFLEKYAFKPRRKAGLTRAAEQAFTGYAWPGNVRELQNLVQSLVITAENELIDILDLPVAMREGAAQTQLGPLERCLCKDLGKAKSLKSLTAAFEREILRKAITEYGSINEAAARLKLDRSTVFRKLKPDPDED